MFCHIINRFLTLYRPFWGYIEHVIYLFTHSVLCIFVYTVIHNHTYIHIQHTYMPIYRHTHIHTYLYMHTHTYLPICTLYLHVYLFTYELSMSYACIKYTYIAYIHICVLVEFCVSFVVTFLEVSGLCFCLPESGWHF